MSEPVRPGGWWRGALKDVALILFVAGLGVKAAVGAAEVRDVDAGDEWAAVWGATGLSPSEIPVECSPLYIRWVRVLVQTGTPLEDVPVLGWSCFAVLLPVSVYLLARSLGAGRSAAFIAGGLLPATTLIDIWPYPMHLAAVVLALGTALAARLPRAPGAAALGLTLVVATYVRPEYLYSLYLFVPTAAAAAVWALWRPGGRRAVLASAAVFAAGSALLIGALGSPQAGAGRPIMAFGQHYAYNWFLRGERTRAPWHEADNILRADFGDASTLGDAWRNNPRAFLWHVRANAGRLPESFHAVATPRVDLSRLHHAHVELNASALHPKSDNLARWALAPLLAWGLVGAAIGLRRWWRGEGGAEGLPVGVLMLGLVAAPALAAVLLIFPRFHYMIPSTVFLIALSAAGARYAPRPGWARDRTGGRVLLVAAAVAFALVVPNRAHGWCAQTLLWQSKGPVIVPVPAPVRASVRAIRELDLRGRVVFLDYSPARSFYTGFEVNCVVPHLAPPGERFLELVRRTNVGVVVLEENMLAAGPLRDDPDARALFEGHDSELFRVFPVPGYPDHRIAVRRDLLPPGK